MTQLAIICDLDDLERWMREFITETEMGQLNPMTTELLFSGFLAWLRKRQEAINGEQTQVLPTPMRPRRVQ